MRKISYNIPANIQKKNSAMFYRETLNRILDHLPEKKLIEVINFARFIKEPENDVPHAPVIISVPAKELEGLTGIVNWGGDAVDDTERLFEG